MKDSILSVELYGKGSYKLYTIKHYLTSYNKHVISKNENLDTDKRKCLIYKCLITSYISTIFL